MNLRILCITATGLISGAWSDGIHIWNGQKVIFLRKDTSLMTKKTKGKTRFIELKKVYDTLHGPHGCMWDKEQTHASLLKDLQEEVDEFAEAVRHKDYTHMQEEIGDILLHVMFQAKIAAKSKKFDIEDVIAGLIRKIKRRHPHVFGKARVRSSSEIIANWNKIKAREKQQALRRKKRGRR